MYHGRTTGKGPPTPAQIYQHPPRLLIVHIPLPSWADFCSNLCEALQNFFSVACSLMGPSRMSLFSLYMVQNQHECILPFVVSISIFVHFILLQRPYITAIITYNNNCSCSHTHHLTSNTMTPDVILHIRETLKLLIWELVHIFPPPERNLGIYRPLEYKQLPPFAHTPLICKGNKSLNFCRSLWLFK